MQSSSMEFVNELLSKNDFNNKKEKPMEDEVEVYRISPDIGKYYETAEFTRKTGKYKLNNEQYFTKKDNIKYVGKSIQHNFSGFGDNAEHWEIFENDNGLLIKVEYTYEGTTCFKEVESLQDQFQFKRDVKNDYDEYFHTPISSSSSSLSHKSSS